MDLKKVCRCCLSEGTKMKNIGVSVIINGQPNLISNIIETCFNIQLLSDDTFPQNICIPCITQLQSAYFMKLKIKETSKIITRRVEEMKREDFSIAEFEDDGYCNDDAVSCSYSPPSAVKQESEVKFYCLQCKSSFSTPLTLKQHYRQKHRPAGMLRGIYKCKCCLERFTNLQLAGKHRERHLTPNTCCWCADVITDYDSHLLSCDKYAEFMASDQRQTIPCHHCGKSYLRDYLRVHLLTHGPDVLKCPLCERGFKVKGNLATHMKVMHSQVRPHKCPYCERYFKLSGTRKRHIRKDHLKERNQKCEECGKGFFTRKCLLRHMCVHTGEKHFKCLYCDKAYQNSWGLKMHTKSQHSKQRTADSLPSEMYE